MTRRSAETDNMRDISPSEINLSGSAVVLLESGRMHISVATLGDAGEVVVKRFKMCDQEATRRFEAERKHLHELSQGSGGENVLRPIGVIAQAPTYALVLPYCRLYGSLDKVVHGFGRPSLTAAWRLCLARDCVAGVVAAHAAGLVIRDIKPANVLVGDDGVGRLADLELARTQEEIAGPPPRHMGGPASRPRARFEGTPEYAAPELVHAYLLIPGVHAQMRSASFASDIFALGITLNQVMTGIVPYSDVARTDAQLHTVIETSYTPLALCRSVADDGLRPAPASGPIGRLACAMWVAKREDRISTKHVARNLDEVVADQGLNCAPSARSSIGPFFKALDLQASCRPSGASTPSHHYAINAEGLNIEAIRQLVFDQLPPAQHNAVACRHRFLAGAGEGMAGRRERMEDAFAIAEWIAGEAACYVIVDGHAGNACAFFIAKHLPTAIGRACLSAEGADISGALRKAFLEVEAAWQAVALMEADCSGSCALAALILGDYLWVAHCGDCRAVLDLGESEDGRINVQALTVDHVISDQMIRGDVAASEAARVARLGGTFRTTADGRHRLCSNVDARLGLQVTRSFGDEPRYPGVIAEPVVVHTTLTAGNRFLILATDGLWDVMSERCAVERLLRTCHHKDFGAKRLVGDAFDLGSKDNICAIVVYLSDVGYSIQTEFVNDEQF